MSLRYLSKPLPCIKHPQIAAKTNLKGQQPLEQVMNMVRGIVNESDNIHSSTRYFSAQLERAEQEIMLLKQCLAATEQDSLHDALTGILNRRAFDADLQNLASVNVNDCGLILADIDHFKQFNDSFGHQLGDQVLKAVTKRLGEHCRDGARVYRYDGEEFAILVPSRPLPQIRHLADSMRRGIEKLPLRTADKAALLMVFPPLLVSVATNRQNPLACLSHRLIPSYMKLKNWDVTGLCPSLPDTN
ncbi:hypothetical protein NFHSH190041_20760 [Shewanella sp. NFH-SH190041]|nr:hypothetical protein NFHSH190041_20760 [Shewanella sp. NFH-SH190041]